MFLDLHPVSLIQETVFLDCSHPPLLRSWRNIIGNQHHFSPTTSCSCHLRSTKPGTLTSLNMIIFLLLTWRGTLDHCWTTETVPSSKCRGHLWLTPIQWSEFSRTAHVSIPAKKRTEGTCFPSPPNPQAWADLSGVPNKPQMVLAAENQNTSCYS